MKKTFSLRHPKIKPARLLESARHDVKKYLQRELNKELPKGFDCWNFDCKFGENAEDAKVIDVAEISKCIGTAEEKELESFYLEIIAKPGNKPKKVKKSE